MADIKTIDELDARGKRALVRVDLDVYKRQELHR